LRVGAADAVGLRQYGVDVFGCGGKIAPAEGDDAQTKLAADLFHDLAIGAVFTLYVGVLAFQEPA